MPFPKRRRRSGLGASNITNPLGVKETMQRWYIWLATWQSSWEKKTAAEVRFTTAAIFFALIP